MKRCSLGAREIVDGKKTYDASRCLGCGLCVTTCPKSAIKLVERKKTQANLRLTRRS